MVSSGAVLLGLAVLLVAQIYETDAGVRIARSPQFGGFSQASAQAQAGGFGPPRPYGFGGPHHGGFGGGFQRPGFGGSGFGGGQGGGSISISKSISISRGPGGAQSSSSAGSFGK